MPEISIVIPVFNAEEYLAECIESILSQNYSDFELLLVNDGSTDSSKAICEDFVKKDKRVILINQENTGVSSARNNGILQAKGKYLMFCDSDDCVSPNWCSVLYTAIRKNPESLVVSNVTKNYNDLYKGELQSDYELLTYFELYKSGLSAYTPNKIYNLSIIKKNNIIFDVDCNFSEDVKFNIDYFSHCKNIILIDQKLYFYRQTYGLTNSYRYNKFELHLMPFYIRLNTLKPLEISKYCDIWLYHFINLFNNVFDKRNTEMSLLQKFKFNNKMIKTEEFQYCVEKSSENNLLKKILKTKNYYIFWLFQKITSLKQKLRSK